MHSTCNKNEIPLRRVPCKYNGSVMEFLTQSMYCVVGKVVWCASVWG